MKNDFWFYSLIVLLIVAVAAHWPFWLRVAVVTNSIVVLFDVARQARRMRRKGE